MRTRASEPSDGGPTGGSTPTHLFIIGAGYVGLVTAVGMARLGHRVTLSDIDAARIADLEAGNAPIWEPGLEEALAEVRERLTFTTEAIPPADARFSFVTVGTPLRDDGLMDFGNVETVVGRTSDVPWNRPIAFLLGNEGAGLPTAVAARADRRVAIPMAAPVESLNVSVAAGVLLFEAARQRSQAPR